MKEGQGMLRSHLRRISLVTMSVLLAFSFTMGMFAFTPKAAAATRFVGAKHYYLGLGDSLAFGFQPDLNWDEGYVEDLYYQNLQYHGSSSLTNYGCNGETSNSMISGNCPYWYILHNYYWGAQLTAAVNFLNNHKGNVSPVTLDMGANDLLPYINASNCSISSSWTSALSTLNYNLNNIILPKLVNALTVNGVRTGDLVMMNYYDPFALQCPNTIPYVQQLNTNIQNDAAMFGIPVVNVYAAFGGSNQASNICSYTWMCSFFNNIHPTSTGYQVIANAFTNTLGY